jgi:hypothetical protein
MLCKLCNAMRLLSAVLSSNQRHVILSIALHSQIRIAYRAAASRAHPEQLETEPATPLELAAARRAFIDLCSAYSVLSDHVWKRKRYDYAMHHEGEIAYNFSRDWRAVDALLGLSLADVRRAGGRMDKSSGHVWSFEDAQVVYRLEMMMELVDEEDTDSGDSLHAVMLRGFLFVGAALLATLPFTLRLAARGAFRRGCLGSVSARKAAVLSDEQVEAQLLPQLLPFQSTSSRRNKITTRSRRVPYSGAGTAAAGVAGVAGVAGRGGGGGGSAPRPAADAAAGGEAGDAVRRRRAWARGLSVSDALHLIRAQRADSASSPAAVRAELEACAGAVGALLASVGDTGVSAGMQDSEDMNSLTELLCFVMDILVFRLFLQSNDSHIINASCRLNFDAATATTGATTTTTTTAAATTTTTVIPAGGHCPTGLGQTNSFVSADRLIAFLTPLNETSIGLPQDTLRSIEANINSIIDIAERHAKGCKLIRRDSSSRGGSDGSETCCMCCCMAATRYTELSRLCGALLSVIVSKIEDNFLILAEKLLLLVHLSPHQSGALTAASVTLTDVLISAPAKAMFAEHIYEEGLEAEFEYVDFCRRHGESIKAVLLYNKELSNATVEETSMVEGFLFELKEYYLCEDQTDTFLRTTISEIGDIGTALFGFGYNELADGMKINTSGDDTASNNSTGTSIRIRRLADKFSKQTFLILNATVARSIEESFVRFKSGHVRVSPGVVEWSDRFSEFCSVFAHDNDKTEGGS